MQPYMPPDFCPPRFLALAFIMQGLTELNGKCRTLIDPPNFMEPRQVL